MMTILPNEERRRSTRVPYPAEITVAEYDGKEYPDASSYFKVDGRDISTTGMAFHADRPMQPDSMMIISAGALLIVSRVRHCQEEGGEDARRYSIGCEFVRRFSQPTPIAL